MPLRQKILYTLILQHFSIFLRIAVEYTIWFPKLKRRVRFPYPAPKTEGSAKADPSVFGKVGIETNSDFV